MKRTKKALSFRWSPLVTQSLIALALIACASGQEDPPKCSIAVDPPGQRINVYETTPVGETAFTFTVNDGNPDDVFVAVKDDTDNLWILNLKNTYDSGTKVGTVVVDDTLLDLGVDQITYTIYTTFDLVCQYPDDQTVSSDLPTLQLDIVDGNNNPPVFSSASYTFTIPEDFPLSFDISIGAVPVESTDADKGNTAVEYTVVDISGGELATKYFSASTEIVDEKTSRAVLKLIRALDFESMSSFEFTLRATNTHESDPFEPVQTAETTVRVTVTDAFDDPLQFKKPSYTIVMNDPSVSDGDSVLVTPGPIEFVDTAGYGAVSFSLKEPAESNGILNNFFVVEPSGAVLFTGSSFEDLVAAANGQSMFVALLEAKPEVNPLLGTSAIFQVEIDSSVLTTGSPETTTVPSYETTDATTVSQDTTTPVTYTTDATTVSQGTTTPVTYTTLTTDTSTSEDTSDASSQGAITSATDVTFSTSASSSDGPGEGTTTSPNDITIEFDEDSATGTINIHPAVKDQPVFAIKATATEGTVFYAFQAGSEYFSVGSRSGIVRATSLTPLGSYAIAVRAYLAGNSNISNIAKVSLEVTGPPRLFEKRFYSADVNESDLKKGAEMFTIELSPDEGSSTELDILKIQAGEGCQLPGTDQDILRIEDLKILFHGETGSTSWHTCPTGIYAKIGEKGSAASTDDDIFDVGWRETIFWLNIKDENDNVPTLAARATGQDPLTCNVGKVAGSSQSEISTQWYQNPRKVSMSELNEGVNVQSRTHPRALCEEIFVTAFFSENVDWPMPYPSIAELMLEDDDSPEMTSFMMRIEEDQDGSQFELLMNDDGQNSGRAVAYLAPKEGLDCDNFCSFTFLYSDDPEVQRGTHELFVQVAVLEPENLMFLELPSEEAATTESVLSYIEDELVSENSNIRFGIVFAQTHKAKGRGKTGQKAAFQTIALVYGLNAGDPRRPATYEYLKESLNIDGIPGIQVQNFTNGMVTQVTEIIVNESTTTDDGGKIAAIVMGVIMALLLAACAVFLYKRKIMKRNKKSTPGDHFTEHRDTLKIRKTSSSVPSMNGSLGRRNEGFASEGGRSGGALQLEFTSETDGARVHQFLNGGPDSPTRADGKRKAPQPPSPSPPTSPPPPPPPPPPRMPQQPLQMVTAMSVEEKIPVRQVSFTDDPPKQIFSGSRRVSFADEQVEVISEHSEGEVDAGDERF